MLCNDAQEKTKSRSFAPSTTTTMEKEAFCSFAMGHDRVN